MMLTLSNVKFDGRTGAILKYVPNYSNIIIPDNFWGAPVLLVRMHFLIKRVTIPESVTTIGSYAFADNELRTVSVLQSLKPIDYYIFANNNLKM